MNGFIKDTISLEDNHKVDDLFDMHNHRDDIWKKIQGLPNKSIMSIVGPYGSGKSTMMYNIEKLYTNDSMKWIHFDAWKYPERRDMWEGFILDIAEQIGTGRSNVADEIDGKNITVSEGIITTLSAIPLLGGIDKLNKIFESRGARRVFDLQEILKKILLNFDKDITIIIEDIDRSGEYGILFLETLNQFLKNYLLEKNIKVITLISKDSYNKNLESYLKCIDAFEFFTPNYNNFEKFLDTYFIDNSLWVFPNVRVDNIVVRGQIISFLLELSKIMSVRLIKNILRKANLIYERQINDGITYSDFRIVIAIEASRFYKIQGSQFTEFERFQTQGSVTMESVIGKFIKIIFFNVRNFGSFKQYESNPKTTSPIFIERPELVNEDDEETISGIYFKY